MNANAKKRQVDFQVIAQWVAEGDRVLDLGCGRGVLLEYLKQTKGTYGVGVDIDFDKILSCVKRGVPVYQGDVNEVLASFPDDAFDRVIFSRTVEQLDDPAATLAEGLRVGKRVTVGFVNQGYWINRVNAMLRGRRTINDVYPDPWYAAIPANPFSVSEFEEFCLERGIRVENKVHLAGNWRSECSFLPNLFSGYAIYDLEASA
ncbi:MAG: methionine biosynthesis protein MetW [Verrucomicrobiota bacterium]